VPSNNDVKSYWNSRPCNINHSSAKVGTMEYIKQVAEKRYFVEPHIPKFANFIGYSGKKVLEIGSGIGTDAISFALNGAEVYSGDISSVSVDISKKNAQALSLDNLVFFEHDFQNRKLPITSNFDLIYSFGVIHHCPEPQLIFNNLKSWANPLRFILDMDFCAEEASMKRWQFGQRPRKIHLLHIHIQKSPLKKF